MSDMRDKVNPLLQIDTGFRSYLNAYTRSYQSHMVDGSLDYAFESDFVVRQKINGLGGQGKAVQGGKHTGYRGGSQAPVHEMRSGGSAEISRYI